MLIGFLCFLVNENALWVQVQPFDFQRENQPDTLIEGIRQIEISGGSLYVLAANEPTILELDLQGGFIRKMGSKGQGPEDWGYFGPLAMSLYENTLWVIPNNPGSMHYLEAGKQVLRYPLQSFLFNRSSEASNVFAHNGEIVVVPCHPSFRHLAAVYGYDGKIRQYMGDILPIDPDLLTKNPALNDTFWTHDGKHWYALFKYWNRLVKYDHGLNNIAEFRLEGEEIDYCEGVFLGDIEPEFALPPQPYFTDFKCFNGHLFFLCEGVLYQVEPERGKTLSRVKFRGRGPVFEKVNPTKSLRFNYFSFFPDGKVLLADSAMIWGHDLWIATIPSLFKR